jgi:AGCS family alanine or glycine:cation symporter
MMETALNGAVDALERVLFVRVGGLPLIILWLLLGASFFTLRMGFINLRGFKHAIDVALGRYDTPDEQGDVSHFQAVATALSATIGLGNIAGVAIAIQLGGPGAVVWMTLVGLLGMSSKFVECTLAQKYRTYHPDGTVAGGPMYYLSQGLAGVGLKPLGQGLAILFATLCGLGGVGGGNMFQASQAYAAIVHIAPVMGDYRWAYGLGLSLVVGLVILGGIRRIGAVAGAIVPTMAALYIGAAFWVLLAHSWEIPAALQLIWQGAWQPEAVSGGAVGVMVQGIRRGLFSNAAGVGTSAIAHAATRTQEPIREGIVASLEPFIDTVVICNLTALVCVITGTYRNAPETALGFDLVAMSFDSVVSGFSLVLTGAVCLFAFSTIISWAYYGEQCWRYLTRDASPVPYRLFYVGATFLGSVTQPSAVLTFSDLMLFAIAVPNMLGCLLLSNQVARDLADYWQRLLAGAMPVHGVQLGQK